MLQLIGFAPASSSCFGNYFSSSWYLGDQCRSGTLSLQPLLAPAQGKGGEHQTEEFKEDSLAVENQAQCFVWMDVTNSTGQRQARVRRRQALCKLHAHLCRSRILISSTPFDLIFNGLLKTTCRPCSIGQCFCNVQADLWGHWRHH